MKQLNRDHFFIWFGEFNQEVSANIANDDTKSMRLTELYVDIYPLANDSSTFGINPASLEITVQDNVDKPAIWDPIAKRLTYFLPASAAVGTTRQLKYRWKDTAGNQSNEATIHIAVADRPSGWRGHAPSYKCIKDASGQNTGQAYYEYLERYYTDDGTAYQPQELRLNTELLPEYIAPENNFGLCPIAAQTLDFSLFCYTNQAAFRELQFIRQGVAVLTIPMDHQAINPQPRKVKVEGGAWDMIRVKIVNIDAVTMSFNPGSGGAGGGTQLVTQASTTDGVWVEFAAVTLGTFFGGEITLTD